MKGIIEIPWFGRIMYAVILSNSDVADLYRTIEEARAALLSVEH